MIFRGYTKHGLSGSILDPSLGVLWSTEYMWEWDCYATESTPLLFLFDFGVSICQISFFLGKTNPTVVLQHQAQKHMACFRLVPMEHLNTGCYTLLMILTQLGIPLVWHSVIWQLRSISVEFFSILSGYLQSSNS